MNKNYDLIWQALSGVSCGSLKIKLPDGLEKNFTGINAGPNAEMAIKDYNFIDSVIAGGDVALGEGYMQNLWESDDLEKLLTFFTLNAHALEDFFHARRFQALVLFIKSFLTKNTKRGSKKNIEAHYDLGNDFYQLWLESLLQNHFQTKLNKFILQKDFDFMIFEMIIYHFLTSWLKFKINGNNRYFFAEQQVFASLNLHISQIIDLQEFINARLTAIKTFHLDKKLAILNIFNKILS